MYASTYLATLALATLAYAKTDLAGCTSSAIGASLLWYVPSDGEICSILDCGGGRAPAKTTVPGCAAYVGTEVYQPSYIPNYGEASATTSVEAEPTTYGGQETTSAYYTASASATEYQTASESEIESTGASTLATITSAATLSQHYPIGTGSATIIIPSGGNNVTGTATLTSSASESEPTVPESTGAASLMKGVAKGALGLAVGVVGLAVL